MSYPARAEGLGKYDKSNYSCWIDINKMSQGSLKTKGFYKLCAYKSFISSICIVVSKHSTCQYVSLEWLYEDFCFDVAEGCMNVASSKTQNHLQRIVLLSLQTIIPPEASIQVLNCDLTLEGVVYWPTIWLGVKIGNAPL